MIVVVAGVVVGVVVVMVVVMVVVVVVVVVVVFVDYCDLLRACIVSCVAVLVNAMFYV